jgi:hypothetical protein
VKVFKPTDMNWYFIIVTPFHLLLLFSGTSRRTKFFGTFPGNYVKRLWITLPPYLCRISALHLHKLAWNITTGLSLSCLTVSNMPSPSSPAATKLPAEWLPLWALGRHNTWASTRECIFLLSAPNWKVNVWNQNENH